MRFVAHAGCRQLTWRHGPRLKRWHRAVTLRSVRWFESRWKRIGLRGHPAKGPAREAAPTPRWPTRRRSCG